MLIGVIFKMSDVYIIAELCGQWGGSVRRAEQMILQCKMAGADAVKVQLWDTYRMPGENRELWEYLTMTKEQYSRLKDYAEKLNIDFFASPFHRDRFEWTQKSSAQINKIASSMLEWDFDFCKDMVETGMFTYCSLGKWDKDEYPFENENVKYFHCVAKYPHTFEEAMEVMPEKFDDRLIGYSDHTVGNEACEEAVRRGAKVLEKHFTIDYNLQCKTESAHICSMNFGELIRLRSFCDSLNVST
jgi:N,N'-diacetyllegionaminate synthase